MPADRTLPMNTSWTASGASFARFKAPSMAMAPKRGAERGASEPRKDPTGVRAAATMKTGSVMAVLRCEPIEYRGTAAPSSDGASDPHGQAMNRAEVLRVGRHGTTVSRQRVARDSFRKRERTGRYRKPPE